MKMLEKKSWDQFRRTGLLCIINSLLHIFGWSIVVVVDDKEHAKECYPARVKFRGFDEKSQTKAYRKISSYMVRNSKALLKEANE